ncbi:hypothetical protein C1909_10955 [Listeria ivanovii]|nr:hypothetical protein JL52_13770 [Listeria ivanovii subsp. ivanovii]PZG37807.1 hypothetical protein C1910_10945 [Listeria ivanovii]PZG51831.1 hypothetical protein C1909_10955 [Listeria ivanovii]SNV49580.1 Uncharacterised protein [Listeria ivanovii subsp. ivanovii]SNV99431.1 Uncharacterised protein [Listeria ivanovii subsp. ivanovii]
MKKLLSLLIMLLLGLGILSPPLTAIAEKPPTKKSISVGSTEDSIVLDQKQNAKCPNSNWDT